MPLASYEKYGDKESVRVRADHDMSTAVLYPAEVRMTWVLEKTPGAKCWGQASGAKHPAKKPAGGLNDRRS